MARITPLTLQTAGDATETLTALNKQMGKVPNIFATMAHSPAVLEAFLGFSGALGKGALDAGVREQIALVVAGENSCDYCASAHTLMAKGAGVSEVDAAKSLSGDSDDSRVSAILTFAKELVANRGVATDAQVNTLKAAGVNDAELVEILAHVGINLFTNYFNHVVETDIDFPLVSTAAVSKIAV